MSWFGGVEGGDLVKCSFCGKTQKQVKKVVAGPGVYICDECLALCNDIVGEEEASPTLPGSTDTVPVPRQELTAVARTLDQAAGAIGASNLRVADDAMRLASRLQTRLQVPVEPVAVDDAAGDGTGEAPPPESVD